MMVFRIAEAHHSLFVMWLLNCVSTFRQALQDAIGATVPHVNVSTIRNYSLAMPERAEQESIVKHIDLETRSIEAAMDRLEREIELLREYRTRLVADVVTGKLDVREAAARLPDEPAPDTGEDAAELSDQTEPVDEEAPV